MPGYKRTLEELAQHTVMYWPAEVREQVAAVDFLQRLVDSHDQFLSIIGASGASPDAWEGVLQGSGLAGNLFLKHLLMVSDVAVEALKKLPPLHTQFAGGVMKYGWQGNSYEYRFRDTSNRKVSSGRIFTDTNGLLEDHDMTAHMHDLAMLVLHGAASTNPEQFENADLLAKCKIGQFLGNPLALSGHTQRLYLSTGNQSTGAGANARGQALQSFALSILREDLPTAEGWVLSSGSIAGVEAAEGRETTFDIVVRGPNDKITGVEVSFQETTNSVIERKAREARDVQAQLHARGHALAFVLDGVGNIRIRQRAAATICLYSDCTVGFSLQELRVLANFLRERSGLPALPLLTPAAPPQSQPQQP